MRALVVGATGATGRLLVEQLLARDLRMRVIVRSSERLPAAIRGHGNLQTRQASVLDLGDEELAGQVAGCDAVASCLGHNLSLKGIYGQPRRRVARSAPSRAHLRSALWSAHSPRLTGAGSGSRSGAGCRKAPC